MTQHITPGFPAPVRDAQASFRAVLDAMAHPGREVTLAPLDAPAPLAPATAAVLLTLADAEIPLHLGPGVEAAADWVRFHCGSPLVGPDEAEFALYRDLPPLETLRWGTDEVPQDGATILLQTDAPPRPWRLAGPGLQAPETRHLALPPDFATRWRPVRAAFPRGVDLLLCAGSRLVALPRTLAVEPA